MFIPLELKVSQKKFQNLTLLAVNLRTTLMNVFKDYVNKNSLSLLIFIQKLLPALHILKKIKFSSNKGRLFQ